MKIDIISVVPDLMSSPFSHSILKRAQERGLLELAIYNPRDYTNYKHGQVDDYQFGGGAGMVMMPEPLINTIEALQKTILYEEIIFVTPDGITYNQQLANQLSLKNNLLVICGHYKGIDERVREHFVTREISIGDYVLSGGELAAAVLVDSIVRLIPGVINDETSALTDSFQDNLLAPPVYTRPAEFRGWKVPEVLLSGDQKKIDEWRYEASLKRTQEKRPDLIRDQE